jgi:hypothetical protein
MTDVRPGGLVLHRTCPIHVCKTWWLVLYRTCPIHVIEGLGVLLEGMILSCHHVNALVPLHNAMVEQRDALL